MPAIDRSSDLQASNIPTGRCFPDRVLRSSAWIRRSFLLTAAGQFRIRTGFPCDGVGNVAQIFRKLQTGIQIWPSACPGTL